MFPISIFMYVNFLCSPDDIDRFKQEMEHQQKHSDAPSVTESVTELSADTIVSNIDTKLDLANGNTDESTPLVNGDHAQSDIAVD
jgi:hypothetical protein